MIIQNEALKEAIINIIYDTSEYLENLRILIDVSEEEISDQMLTSNIRALYSSVNYLAKILTEEDL